MQRIPSCWTAHAGIAMLLCIVSLVGCTEHGEDEKRTEHSSQESTWPTLSDQSSFRTTTDLSKYPELSKILVNGITVPGLTHNFVPQGISWVPNQDGLVLISGYVGKHLVGSPQRWCGHCQRGVVILMSVKKEKPVRIGQLVTQDGGSMLLHGGGVAVTGKYFWIPACFRVYRFPIKALLESNDKVVSLSPVEANGYRVDALGSFVSFDKKHLWVGDFISHTDTGAGISHHRAPKDGDTYAAWTAGYLLNEDEEIRSKDTYTYRDMELLRPDVVFHHRRRVQGLAFYGDGEVVFSVSYGNRSSKFAFYDLGDDPWNGSVVKQTRLPDGSKVPSRTVRKLPGPHGWIDTLMGPPGSEGIAWNETHLITLFEGGAKPYRDRWTVLEDRIMILKLP